MKIVKEICKKIITFVMYILRIFPIQENKILFSAFSARYYSDNPKYIAEYIIKNNLDYKCVFVLKNKSTEGIPEKIKVVKYNSLSFLYELVTAKFWIDNTRKQSFVVKRKNQIYIQTWHGSILLKKIEQAAEKVLDKEYVDTAKKDSKNIDYLLVSSKWGKETFEKCFWYNGKICITGSPRVDILVNDSEQVKQETLKKLKLNKNKKILLYAPTFRRDSSNKAYTIDYKRMIQVLREVTGNDWIILTKLHPNIANLNLIKDEDVVNVSNYPDISELYLISDMLITDYSSTMFDFSITKKPVLLYCADIDEYIDERNFNLDLFKLPYAISQNNDELERNIRRFNYEEYLDRLKNFFEKLDIIEDGLATKRVIEIIDKEKK